MKVRHRDGSRNFEKWGAWGGGGGGAMLHYFTSMIILVKRGR